MNQTRPHHDPQDSWVRELLEGAVADVTPQHGLDAIRARTATTSRRGRRAWLWGAGATVVATAATVAAVVTLSGGPGTTRVGGPGFANGGTVPSSISSNGTVPQSPTTSSPQVLTSPSGTATTSGAPSGTVTPAAVYYLGQTPRGVRLYVEQHQVSSDDPALYAVRAAVSGAPYDPDYQTLWPQGTEVTAVTQQPNGITVSLASSADLTTSPAGMSGDTARIAVQQLVYTAQDAVGSQDPVTFTVNGQPVGKLLGVDVSGGVQRADPLGTESPVTITSPTQGAEVPGTFTVQGKANSFEGNLLWEVLDQHGKQVASDHTTAGAYTIDPYSFTVKDLPPGQYTLVVHNDDPSGQNQVTKDTREITVR